MTRPTKRNDVEAGNSYKRIAKSRPAQASPHVLLIVSSLACNGSVDVAGGLRHDGLVPFVCSVCRTKTERESCMCGTRLIFSSLETPRGAPSALFLF